MVLAVPMLMMIKSVCDHVEDLQPIGERLGESLSSNSPSDTSCGRGSMTYTAENRVSSQMRMRNGARAMTTTAAMHPRTNQ